MAFWQFEKNKKEIQGRPEQKDYYKSGHGASDKVDFRSKQKPKFHATYLFLQYRVHGKNFKRTILKIFSAYKQAKGSCNMVIERKFYGLFSDIFKNHEKLFYEAEFAFFQSLAESVNKLIYQILVSLRSTSSIWKLPWSMTINSSTIQSH